MMIDKVWTETIKAEDLIPFSPFEIEQWVKQIAQNVRARGHLQLRTIPASLDKGQPWVGGVTLDEIADVLIIMACLLDSLSERWPVTELMDVALRKSAVDEGRVASGRNDGKGAG